MHTAWLIALVAGATVAVVVAEDDSWWQNAVLYQIYPRSFLDTDSNGIGDLAGMTKKVAYLKDLGLSGIWMNPIYPSPDKDFGYDISNFTAIKPIFGNMTDFTNLVKKIHDLDMKILMDLVPNHSSDQHPWFQKALQGISPYVDYYVWYEGESPPNNWQSIMGGSAWQNVSNNKFYYHAFLKEQPDLNYRNELLVQEMLDVMTFWLDQGVDGFRVDAVPYLIESTDIHQNESPVNYNCTPANTWACLNHTLTASQPETFSILSLFKEHLSNYTKMKGGVERIMVTEATYPPSQLTDYFIYNNSDTSTMPFNFQLLSLGRTINATALLNMIADVFKYLPEGHHTNWLLGNHDQNRIAKKIGRGLGDAANMLNLLLPGTTFTYYGEELVMDDSPIKCDEIKDTAALNQGKTCAEREALTRDPERTPMQWDDSENAGFSDKKPWLPVNPDYYVLNVKSQNNEKVSHIKFYKELVSLKNSMINHTEFDQYSLSPYVYSFRRSIKNNIADAYIVVINLNNEQESISLKSNYSDSSSSKYVFVATTNSEKKRGDTLDWSSSNITLRPYEGIVFYSTRPSSSMRAGVSVMLLLSMIFILLRS